MCIFIFTSFTCNSWSNPFVISPILSCSAKKKKKFERGNKPNTFRHRHILAHLDSIWNVSEEKPGALVNTEANKRLMDKKKRYCRLCVWNIAEIYILLSRAHHRFVSKAPMLMFNWLTANKDGQFQGEPKALQAPPTPPSFFRVPAEPQSAVWKRLNFRSTGWCNDALSTLSMHRPSRLN